MKRVVIVGAGVAGLAAAFTLQEKAKEQGLDLECVLVEKNQHFGGKMFSEKIGGFTVEAGPDCFIAEKPSVIKLSEQLGITHRLLNSNENNKGTFVYSGGRMHKLPDGLMMLVPTKIIPFALSPLISWPGKLRMGLDFFIPKKKQDSDETLEHFVMRRVGREALDKIAEPLIGGIHGGNPQTMSLKATFPRFLQMEKNYGSLVLAMLAARRKAPAPSAPKGDKPKRSYFLSFKEGMGELSQALGNHIKKENVFLGEEVTSIERGVGEAGQPLYTLYLSQQGPLQADAIVFAAPANNVAELVQPLDKKLAATLEQIPMGSSASISVAYRKKDLPFEVDTFGFVIPGVEKRKINAVTYSSLKWDYRVPDDEHILIRTFVGGSKNQELALLDDHDMQQMVDREFHKVLGIKADPVMFKVHRWINGRPQYTMGHLERIEAIDGMLANTGMFVAGASYRGIGVPDCAADGVKQAENVLAYLRQ